MPISPTISDAEILDRIEADVKSTLNFLGARIAAQYGDIQTIPRMQIHAEWTAKLLRDIECDLVADAVSHLRDKIPAARDYRLDQVGADRAMARLAAE